MQTGSSAANSAESQHYNTVLCLGTTNKTNDFKVLIGAACMTRTRDPIITNCFY